MIDMTVVRTMKPGLELDKLVAQRLGYRIVNLNTNPMGVTIASHRVWVLVPPGIDLSDPAIWSQMIDRIDYERRLREAVAWEDAPHYSRDAEEAWDLANRKLIGTSEREIHVSPWMNGGVTASLWWHNVYEHTEHGRSLAHALVLLTVALLALQENIRREKP